ncbi:MAG: hypothetical protein ACLQVD_08310 [Capsulimonadaceae bacterium]
MINPAYGKPQPAAPYGVVTLDWIGQAWRLYLEDAGVWVTALIIYGVGYVALALAVHQWLPTSTQPITSVGAHILSANYLITFSLYTAYLLFARASLVHMAVMVVKKERGGVLSLGSAFSGLPYLGHYCLCDLPHLIVNFAGNVLIYRAIIPILTLGNGAVAPGAVLFQALGGMLGVASIICLVSMAINTLLAPGYAMVCDGAPAGRAIPASIRAMMVQLPRAFGLQFILLILWFPGILSCGLGTLAILPVIWITWALAYRDVIAFPAAPPNPAYGYAAYGSTPDPGTWPPPPRMPGQQDVIVPPYGRYPGENPMPQPDRPESRQWESPPPGYSDPTVDGDEDPPEFPTGRPN